jgi:hypothetical protein
MHKRRQWEHLADEDPASGLLNLFDVWIAFAAVLLLATVTYYSQQGNANEMQSKKVDQSVKIDNYRPTNEKLTGNGERLGVAYRLANGEVVYVPDPSQPSK